MNVVLVPEPRSPALRQSAVASTPNGEQGERNVIQAGTLIPAAALERIHTGLRFSAAVQVINGFDGDGGVIVDRRIRDGINDERLAPLGGGASERRDR